MKRPSGESASLKPLKKKKVKTENASETPELSSPKELKSILKKNKTEISSEVNARKKKSSIGNKKPQLKTIKNEVPVDGKPKKSFVKSNSSINQENIESGITKEGDKTNKVISKKVFKKQPNNKSKPFMKKNKGNLKDKDATKDSESLSKKEQRQKQKELRNKRREKEKTYVLPEKSKKIFEELRCKKCPSERRVELASELYKVLTGKFVNSARSHELSRMTQWIIKVGTPEIKTGVVDEVIGESVSLAKTKYANHIVQCMLQHGDKKVKKRLLDQFLGNVSGLIKNRFSAPIIEEYYSKYAKNLEKTYIRQELYSDLFRGARNKTYTSLSEVLQQNPTLKSAILKSIKLNLSKLIDKQYAITSNLVTDVLYDYLQNCEDQDKLDILEILKTNISSLFKTKSGNQILMLLLWESTPKVKKHMVKELKAQVLNIAKSDGNIFLRSLFDSVDDTVLIKKAILTPLLDNAEDLVKDNNGRKVILYLVAHRDTTFFHPAELEKLKKADKSAYVKKDLTVKEKELLAPCVDILLDKIKARPEFWFSEGKIALVTQAILSKGTSEKIVETFNAISSYILDCVKADNFNPIEDAGLHMVLKKLLKNIPVESNGESFSECFIKMCDTKVIKKLITINRGCYVLVSAIETNLDPIISHMKEIFGSEKMLHKLEKQESSGAQLLVNRLKEKSIVQG